MSTKISNQCGRPLNIDFLKSSNGEVNHAKISLSKKIANNSMRCLPNCPETMQDFKQKSIGSLICSIWADSFFCDEISDSLF